MKKILKKLIKIVERGERGEFKAEYTKTSIYFWNYKGTPEFYTFFVHETKKEHKKTLREMKEKGIRCVT